MMMNTMNILQSNIKRILLPAALCMAFIGCSKDSTVEVGINPPPPPPEAGEQILVYNGPSPRDEDVASFKSSVWNNLALETRCGACHIEGDQAPFFVRLDDINEAFDEAQAIVDLTSPALSRMVTKVAEGHNCWESEAAVCADIISRYLEEWANASGAPVKTITLTAPDIEVPGATKKLPADTAAFATHLHPDLRTYCSRCHSENGADGAQQPYFASSDVEVAYAAVRSKIDINTPGRSRLVTRLRNESHNCWSNCISDANEIEDDIIAMGDTIVPDEVDPDLIISNALSFDTAQKVNEGGRVETSVIALYEFKPPEDESDRTAFDTSGVDPALNLEMVGDVEWISSWGVHIYDGRLQGSTSASDKLRRKIQETGEYSIEAWVVPGNVSQEGPARIVSYSGGNGIRNFTLGQSMYNYDFLNRSSTNDSNGLPMVSTPNADEVLQATLQHVVATYDAVEGRKIYVNGELIVDEDPTAGGNINSWDDTFALVLGQETSGEYLWQGRIRLLAIHQRALDIEAITSNYEAGVGEKYVFLFGVSHLIDVPQAYISFQVAQLDDFSYLFREPKFISLDNTFTPTSDIIIEGLRVGMNGVEVGIGQSYGNINVTINGDNYQAEGVPLSTLGAVIPQDVGVDADQFFLTFDRIGTRTYARPPEVEPAPPAPATVPEEERLSDIGLRTFEEINASFSVMTGVPVTESAIASTYDSVKQAMPSSENISGFVAANQMGITQLALNYCNVVVSDSSRRAAFFSGFDFNAAPTSAFDAAGRANIIDPLLRALVAGNVTVNNSQTSLSSQPVVADFETALNQLIDDMITPCGSGCNATLTEKTVTAVCAAALGSSVMLVQ